jgi:hypothetical protein
LTWLFLLGSPFDVTPVFTCDICGQPPVLFLHEAEKPGKRDMKKGTDPFSFDMAISVWLPSQHHTWVHLRHLRTTISAISARSGKSEKRDRPFFV